jgi:hypothetical protein
MQVSELSFSKVLATLMFNKFIEPAVASSLNAAIGQAFQNLNP